MNSSNRKTNRIVVQYSSKIPRCTRNDKSEANLIAASKTFEKKKQDTGNHKHSSFISVTKKINFLQ
jgi:hypothetical protein